MTVYNVHDTGSAANNGIALQDRLTNHDGLGLLVGGDVVNLDANVEYLGPIGLPVLSLASPVTIQTANAGTNFPLNANGYKRVAPDGLANPASMGSQIGGHQQMAKITAPDQFTLALYTGNTGGVPDPAGTGAGVNATGANNWTFLGVEFKAHANNSWTGNTQNSAFELVEFIKIGNNGDTNPNGGLSWILGIASRPSGGTFTLTYQGNTVTVAWPSPYSGAALANNIQQACGGTWSQTNPRLLGSFTATYFNNAFGYAGEGVLLSFGNAATTPLTINTSGLSGGSVSIASPFPYYQGTQGTSNSAPLMWPQTLNDASQLPNNIVFDRCIIWSGFTGPTGQEIRHGVQLHAKAVTIKNSYVYDFKGTGSDCQAVNSYNGCGPISLLNNYLEACTECVIFGGTTPVIPNMQLGAFGAAQSLVQYNLIGHNLAWNANDPAWDGSNWTMKNIFEFKAGGNIKIDNNTFQHSCRDRDQYGYAFLATPRATPSRGQGGSWTQVHDLQFTNNHILDTYRGLEITATDTETAYRISTNSGVATTNVLIRDNLWEDIGNHVHNGIVTVKTSVNAGGGVAAGVNTWSPALVPYSLDALHPSPGYQVDQNGNPIVNSGQTATIQVGTKICFGYPDLNVVPYVWDPNFEICTVTSINSGAGTFTCTNAKSHSGTVNLGIQTDELGFDFPAFCYVDGGQTATGGGTNMTVGVTIDHNTVTTRRTSMLGFALGIGGSNVYRSFYGNWSHDGFAFNNNLVAAFSYGVFQSGDGNSNPAVSGGTGAPKIFQELFADGTCSIRSNLFYLTSLATGAGGSATLVPGWLTAPTALMGGMVSPAGYTGPLYLGSGSADTNLYETSFTGVFFTNWNGGAGGDYSLANSSPYKGKALDGTDIGCRNFVWATDGNGPTQGHVPTPSTTSATSANITSPANEVSTVTVSGSGGTPTGQVVATLDGAGAVTQTLSGGQTTFTFTSPSVGTHTITANYQGDSIFAASSGTATFTVAAPVGTRASRIFLQSIGNPIVYPANEVVTIAVTDFSGQGGTPTGNVIATLDNQNPVTQTLVGGQTTFTFSRPVVGSHTIAFNYQGDSTWASSQLLQSFTVNSPPLTPSQVALSTSTITSPANEPVVVTVSPQPGYTGTPTGNVIATLDNQNPVTQTLVGGQTTFTFTAPSVGTHQVAINYKGDATFAMSTGQGSFRVQQGSQGQPAMDSGVSGYRNAAAVTPSDGTDLSTPALALYVGVTGNLVLNMLNGQTVTLVAVPAGTFVYLNIARVKATGTTAGSLVALW